MIFGLASPPLSSYDAPPCPSLTQTRTLVLVFHTSSKFRFSGEEQTLKLGHLLPQQPLLPILITWSPVAVVKLSLGQLSFRARYLSLEQ